MEKRVKFRKDDRGIEYMRIWWAVEELENNSLTYFDDLLEVWVRWRENDEGKPTHF